MSQPAIPITGIGPDFRTPGAYAEIVFAQGPASAAAGVREIVLVMPKLSTGSWTAATLYGPIAHEQEVISGAGAGSMLHRAARILIQENKDARVWALPVAETSGGSPVAATATAVVAGGSPTGTGVAVVTICGEDSSYTFEAGETVTAIGDGLVEAINGKTWLPVTAANAGGTVTLTAKLLGASQGTATVAVIRTRGTITAGVGTTLTVSTHLGAVVAGADGTTTEPASALTALATLDSVRKYYIVSSGNVAAYLQNFQTHITTKSAPKRGYRSVGLFAYVGTQAAGVTLATARNYERLNLIVQPNSDHDCAELAGWWAAKRQAGEQLDTAYNFDGETGPMLKRAFNPVDWPDPDEQSDALNDGVTIVATNDTTAYVVMSVNTRSKNSTGTVDDFRATETHRVSVADEFVDECLIDWALNHAKKKLSDDEKLADGTVNPTQRLRKGVLIPSKYAATLKKRVDDFAEAEKLQDAEKSKDSVRCVKSPVNSGRLEAGLDLRVIDHAHQLTLRAAEVSTG